MIKYGQELRSVYECVRKTKGKAAWFLEKKWMKQGLTLYNKGKMDKCERDMFNHLMDCWCMSKEAST